MKLSCRLVLIIFLVQLGTSDADSNADYERGMALAKEKRWEEARKAFLDGQQYSPNDKRFPTELAGIAFRQHRYGIAKSYLHRSLRLDPNDSYVLEFLGTIYFLEENLDAALLHWNHIARPQIENVKIDGKTHIRSSLLDRSFAFSPAGLLRLSQLQETEARLKMLGIFPRYSFELVARTDEKFDLVFHSLEKNGWGNSRLQALLSFFRGIPYQTIYPEFYNWRAAAINFNSLARWDADKRRIFMSVSGPISSNPKYHFQFDLDGRRENWHVPALAEEFQLQKVEASFQMQSVLNAEWNLESSVSVSDIEINGTSAFNEGRDANSRISVVHNYEFPDQRLRLCSFAGVLIGGLRRAGVSPTLYSQLEAGSELKFAALAFSLRFGKSFGTIPFDREYMLGVEQDNDLWLRAHSGLRKQKGALPLGSDFVLFNWEADKTLYRNPFFQGSAGPFIDGGKTYDASPYLGTHQWLIDGGVQAKFRLMNSITTVLVLGKNLRTGASTVYVNITN